MSEPNELERIHEILRDHYAYPADSRGGRGPRCACGRWFKRQDDPDNGGHALHLALVLVTHGVHASPCGGREASGEPTKQDVDALADVISRMYGSPTDPDDHLPDHCRAMARAILNSDWLAEQRLDAAARARMSGLAYRRGGA